MENGEVQLVLEEITPERALDLIVGNTNNRNIRENTINAYARDMKEGVWKAGQGEPIHIDPKTGEIGNGQHRLLAVIEAEVTITLPILYAPIEWRMAADQGIKRTFGDILHINHHEPNQHALAAAVRYIWEYRRCGVFGAHMNYLISTNSGTEELLGKPTVAELEQVYIAERGLKDSLVWMARMRESGVTVFPSLYASLDYLFREVNYDDAEDFSTKMWRSENLSAGHPILALRRIMQSGNVNRPHRARTQAALIIKTWNSYREGEDVQIVSWRSGGANPEPYPHIHGMPESRFNRRR